MISVSSMALHGGPLMRYDPCSLGFLYFDKLSDKFWQGVVNLHLYTNLTSKVEFNVYFEKQVKVYGVSKCFIYMYIYISLRKINSFKLGKGPLWKLDFLNFSP